MEKQDVLQDEIEESKTLKKKSCTTSRYFQKAQTHPSQLLPIQIIHHSSKQKSSMTVIGPLHQMRMRSETRRKMQRVGREEEKKVYWNFLGKTNCNLTGIQWTAVAPIRHFHEDTQTALETFKYSPRVPF